ncbi:MAG: IS21 family transposase [Gammaproteobacteria bacterium]|nr:IS21 family transposase [Gammaproteobacteria bacterium]
MIHKIKAMHDGGHGLSIRAISQQLNVSRNTVRKYLRMDEPAISEAQLDRSREKRLDVHRVYIKYLLEEFPRLSAVKVARKLKAKVGDVGVSDRSLRRYVRALKEIVAVRQERYYAPVLDLIPGVQCQVDPGELRGVAIGGEEQTVYFVVFVLSFSRLTYTAVSFEPIDTTCFLRMHDEAFRYFGGVPEECVYDQTKLVVIEEQYRELTVNQRFHAFATAAGFRVHACRGYDPESKGKVEAGVKYVKQDCLYGERFQDRDALRGHVLDWLDEVANVRLHGTTGRQPREHFEAEERGHLRPYLTPPCVAVPAAGLAQRKVDKVGLISWSANKYSVPMVYQRGTVGVQEVEDALVIHDLETGDEVARHPLSHGKGERVRNNHHYRDPAQQARTLEAEIREHLGPDLGERLCQGLKRTSPRIYKDQLVAASKLVAGAGPAECTVLEQLAARQQVTATGIKRYLEAHHQARQRGREVDTDVAPGQHIGADGLLAYGCLGQSAGQEEVTHGAA